MLIRYNSDILLIINRHKIFYLRTFQLKIITIIIYKFDNLEATEGILKIKTKYKLNVSTVSIIRIVDTIKDFRDTITSH